MLALSLRLRSPPRRERRFRIFLEIHVGDGPCRVGAVGRLVREDPVWPLLR